MFVEKALTSKVGKPRQLVQGVGINDARYVTGYTDSNGKKHTCPYYSTWAAILERVYSSAFHARNPTYLGCTLEAAWETFSVFRQWMEQQAWQGNALDKDLLIPGNKHYGPLTCVFVPQHINSLTSLRGNARGKLPLGVTLSRSNGYEYYVAKCSFYGKQKTLGSFKTVREAEQTYLTHKKQYLTDLAAKENNPRVKQALLNLPLV